jgi:thiosulfate dehydrogenase (quinone) large subunit
MSRRNRIRTRRDGSIRDSMRRPRGGPPRPDSWGFDAPDPATLLDRMTLALLPLRIFLGVTFVYAGVDKLIDPGFLRATGPGSIGSQLEEFAKVSPIAPLVQVFGQTFPVEIGFLIAVAEIAIGLGALSGLLFRLSAVGGLALSVLFWLTASWATKPYYYGPDLPYAFGWLTVALAGTGGRFTLETWLAREFNGSADDEPLSPERRLVLRAGLLGMAAIAVAGVAGTVGASILGRSKASLGAGTSTPAPSGGATGQNASPSLPSTASSSATGAVEAGPGSTPAAAPGPLVARVSQLASGRAVTFIDPITGDPGVLLKLGDGSIVAFDAVCPHAGCTVEYDRSYGYLLCPCHGAAFDPTHDAQAVAGPTNQPLAPIPIHVDTASGRITINA